MFCRRKYPNPYTPTIPLCRVRRLKESPDSSASTSVGQTSCLSSTGMPAQNAANILQPLMLNPHSTIFKHGVTCFWLDCTNLVSAFPGFSSQIPPCSLFTSPFSFSASCAREFEAIIINICLQILKMSLNSTNVLIFSTITTNSTNVYKLYTCLEMSTNSKNVYKLYKYLQILQESTYVYIFYKCLQNSTNV